MQVWPIGVDADGNDRDCEYASRNCATRLNFFVTCGAPQVSKNICPLSSTLQNSLGGAHDAMVSSRLIMDLAASQPHKDKFMESRLADWAAACFESELKNTGQLLQKLLRLKPLARTQG
jgi:hypothetical protein